MSLFNLFDISGSAMSAQAKRLNVVASNLANAESREADGRPYHAKEVIFAAQPIHQSALSGVEVKTIGESNSPFPRVYNPHHPLADATGYVEMPNVDVVEEMTNMISASRAYQMNADALNTAKNLLLRTLSIGQS